MNKQLSIALSILLGFISMAQQTFASPPEKADYLVEVGIQNKVASHPAVRSFISSLRLSHCTLPEEVPGAKTMCTLMGTDNNSCIFTFTLECEEMRTGFPAPQKEKVSGAGKYYEADQSIHVYQVMLDSWQDGRDWISHLRQ